MKKLLAIFIIITVCYVNANSIIRLLPNSDFKLRANLFLNKSNIENLIQLAKTTEYTHVSWVKGGELRAGIRHKDGIKWVTPSNLGALISKAESFDYQLLMMTQGKSGNWLFNGYTDIIFLNESRTKMKTVKTEYSYGDKPKYQLCSDVVISDTLNGQCYLIISKYWFLQKYWFTYDIEDSQT